MKKYELTNNTITIGDITLYQIRSLIDFDTIKVGHLGGYIQSETNLSHNDTCWVFGYSLVSGNAQVTDDALVSGNARVSDNAQVFGNAQVTGYALVIGNCWVSGKAVVSDNAIVSGEARVSGNAKVFGNTHVIDNAQLSY